MHANAGDASVFDPLAGALATHRGALLDDAAAVGAALRELGPMLARARTALAAWENPGGWGPKGPGGGALGPPPEMDATGRCSSCCRGSASVRSRALWISAGVQSC
jgi:hypothetical protein